MSEKVKRTRKPMTEEQKERMLANLKAGREKKNAERLKFKEQNEGKPKEYKTTSLTSKINKIENISTNLEALNNLTKFDGSKLNVIESQLTSLSDFIKNIATKEKELKEPIKIEENEPLEVEKPVDIALEENQPIPEYIEQVKINLDEPKKNFDTSRRLRSITSLSVNNNMKSVYKGANIRLNDNPYKNKYKK
jgi:hypothetical protein